MTAAGSETTLEPTQTPGWPEIVIGLGILLLAGFLGGMLVYALPIGPIAAGLALGALSGLAALAGFFAANGWRIQSVDVFGVRPTTWRWIAVAVGVGVVAFFSKFVVALAYIELTGDMSNPQQVFAQGGNANPVSFVLSMFFLGVLTPLGEELLFRGVVTTALLRYGAIIGVVGSALLFAVFHGINIVTPIALVLGFATGEVFRRSGSVWPAVVVHAVFNLVSIPILVFSQAAQATT